MAQFNLNEYETVQQRLEVFWQRFPNGRVATKLIEIYRLDSGAPAQYIVCAELYRHIEDSTPFATGFAEELVGVSQVNKTSALENGETSALGRALRNGNIGHGASREEMEKVERGSASVTIPTNPQGQAAWNWDDAPKKTEEKIYGQLPSDGVTLKDPQGEPTIKQLNAIVKKAGIVGIYADSVPVFTCWVLGIPKVRQLTKQEASSLIGMDDTEWEVKAGLFKVAPRSEYPEVDSDYAPF